MTPTEPSAARRQNAGYREGLSVVVPALNEAALLEETVHHLVRTAPQHGIPVEIIVVDDGSRDATPEIADRLAANHAIVSAYHHDSNQGFGATVRTGFEHARYLYLVYTPVDYHFSAKEFDIYLTLIKYADIVIGYRRERRRNLRIYPWLISVTYHQLVNWLFRLNFYDVNWIHMYRRDQIFDFLGHSEGAFFLAETLIRARWRGARIIGVDVDFTERKAGVATGQRVGTIVKTLRELCRFFLVEALVHRFRRRPRTGNSHLERPK